MRRAHGHGRFLTRLVLLGFHVARAVSDCGGGGVLLDSSTEKGAPDRGALVGPLAAAPAAHSVQRSHQQQQEQHALTAEKSLATGLVHRKVREEDTEAARGERGEEEEEEEEEDTHESRESRELFLFFGRAKEHEKSGGEVKKSETRLTTVLKRGEFNTSDWEGAGGKYGMSADWREAIAMPSGDVDGKGLGSRATSLTGGPCTAEAEQAKVHAILEKRRKVAGADKVAICVRTKDYARFLPEWIAFHYAAGVDEVAVYDDDSADKTEEVLRPFIEAGIVRFMTEKIIDRGVQMNPLNHCLAAYLTRRRTKGDSAPRWVLFHDTDEYLFPTDTDKTIPQALQEHEDTCCVLVPRVQYGSGGHDEMPRGLLLEQFLTHSQPGTRHGNGNPKIVVNLDPARPELGQIEGRLKSMHNAHGCECDGLSTQGVPDLRINHYLGSIGDYMDRTRRYWEEKRMGNMAANHTVLERDVNDCYSDEIVHWACATREVLGRVVKGLVLI